MGGKLSSRASAGGGAGKTGGSAKRGVGKGGVGKRGAGKMGGGWGKRVYGEICAVPCHKTV